MSGQEFQKSLTVRGYCAVPQKNSRSVFGCQTGREGEYDIPMDLNIKSVQSATQLIVKTIPFPTLGEMSLLLTKQSVLVARRLRKDL